MLANKERILQKMEKFNLDAIIASHPENVSYLSDFQGHGSSMYRFLGAESFAIFPRRADIAPALIIRASDAFFATECPSWMEETYTFGSNYYIVHDEKRMTETEVGVRQILDDHEKNAPSAGEVIAKALKQKGLDKGRIGLDEKNLNPVTREKIVSGVPNATLLDAFELFRVIRMVKTPEELERIKVAGLLNERATMSTVDLVAEGVSEQALTQQFLDSTAKEGAVFEFWNTASGTRSALGCMSYGHLASSREYRLKKGDMYRYDGGSIYNRYHSDAGGCAVVGEPTQKQKTCYNAIVAGMERSMELLRPGAIPSKIFEEVVAAVEKAGLPEYGKLAGFCGHGIGIEARDYPVFTHPVKSTSPFLPGSYDVPIEEGMVINIEVPYREFGLGGFQIEYTLLVKKDGCEKLYPHTREMVVR